MGKKKKSKGHKKYKKKEYSKKKKPNWGLRVFLGFIGFFAIPLVLGSIFDNSAVSMAMIFIPVFLFFVGIGFIVFKKAIAIVSIYDESINRNPFFSDEFTQTYEENERVDVDNQKANKKNTTTSFVGTIKSPVYNSPIPYHLSLVVLTLVSLIFFSDQESIINNGFFSRFADDFMFQIVSTILFVILGIFSPFVTVPDVIKNHAIDKEGGLYALMADSSKFFLYRMIFCLFVIALFVFSGWLVFPSFDSSHPVSIGITMTLLLFVGRNIYMMQRYPRAFLKENIFRFFKLIALIMGGAFIVVPMVPVTMLTVNSMGIDENNFNPMPIVFMVFNILAAYLEYAVIYSDENNAVKTSI